VQHPLTRAVGFTGSFEGGKALFDLANSREMPIPVFAEMGSVNPVFLLPEKLKRETAAIADMYAASITVSVGQFCTNPGIIVSIESEELNEFIQLLGKKIESIKPAKMLHVGIAKNFHKKRSEALAQPNVSVAGQATIEAQEDESIPTITQTTGEAFLNNPILHKEIFGPYSLVVRCKNMDEMLAVVQHTEGQLTASLMATNEEVKENISLINALQHICGRFVLNGVPTGVEVALAMHHGGPYPSTTDSRFTSVGADGIKRFARPICYQNFADELLPPELKNENPLGLWRTVNNELTNRPIGQH
jgi:NADP-dependent aldehyde dehydrogenase